MNKENLQQVSYNNRDANKKEIIRVISGYETISPPQNLPLPHN
jgi:hypothetical protein